MAMVGVTAATYGDLESVPLVTRRKYRDGILATIAREDEIAGETDTAVWCGTNCTKS